ncbi:MAG: hypothetical protein ACOCUN_01165, partial [Jiangellaceae bacterium]
PELNEIGADIDDAAALLGLMETEFGLSGRTARQEFRTAINDSDGTLQGMLDTLGISEDQFAKYRDRVSESSDVIGRNADITADSETALFKLQERIGNFLGQHGQLVEDLSSLSPVLMGGSGAIFGFNQLREATSGLGGRLSRIGQSATGASSGLRSIGRAGAAAAVLYAAGEGADFLTDKLLEWQDGPIGTVDDLTLALEGMAEAGEVPESVAGSVDNFSRAVERSEVSGFTETMMDLQSTLHGMPLIGDALGFLSPGQKLDVEQWERGGEALAQVDETMAAAARSGNDALLAEGLELLGEATGLAGDELEAYAREHLPEYAKALDAGEIASDDAAESTDGLGGKMDELADETREAVDAHEEYVDHLRAAEDPVFALDQALRGADEAQRTYNDAVKEHGEDSAEAEEAAFGMMEALSEVERAAIDGDLSFAEFDRRLERWVDEGKITADQADTIRDRVRDLTGAADDYSGEYEATLRADVGQARGAIDGMIEHLERAGFSRGEAAEAARWTARANVYIDATGPGADIGGRNLVEGLEVQQRALGGPFGAGWLLAGESGPELMHVRSGVSGEVFSAANSRRMLNGTAAGGGDGASTAGVLARLDRIAHLLEQGTILEVDGHRLGRLNRDLDRRHGSRNRTTSAS